MDQRADAQKVQVKATYTLATEQMKREAQNRRILGEFPWLWAMRQDWFLPEIKLMVSGPDECLSRLLQREASSDAENGVRLSIYFEYSQKHRLRFLEIPGEFHRNATWQNSVIAGTLPYVGEIKLMAIAVQHEILRGNYHPDVRIYRFKNPLNREGFKRFA